MSAADWVLIALGFATVIAALAAVVKDKLRKILVTLCVGVLIATAIFAALTFIPKPQPNCTPYITGIPAQSTQSFTYTYHVPCAPPTDQDYVAVTELLHQTTTKSGPATGSLFFFKIDDLRDDMQAQSGPMRQGVERNFYILSITRAELTLLQQSGDAEKNKLPTDTGYYNKQSSNALSGGVVRYAVSLPVHNIGI